MNLSPLASTDSAAATPSDPKRIAKIHDAAQQFEALMITQMMKTVRETNSDGWLSDGGETGEDSAMSMAETQFAQAMASRGGLGLANMIVKSMTSSQASSIAVSASASTFPIPTADSKPALPLVGPVTIVPLNAPPGPKSK